MPLKLKSGFLTSSGEDGRLLMDSGAGEEIVFVSRHALESIADPPRVDEFRLQQYIDSFSQIASDKYDGGRLDPTGHVRVTSQDVRDWRAALRASEIAFANHSGSK
ncbi:hypothetical protein LXM94_02025 [Rhizobium sp. TRM95111]|uniref:hypothetical protein n=1 Tax=Rhizobium alarense TaxID=2846851 RepID=UPI001F2F04F1|nr:hypothetical protein [Rhizobium alarense]MCF3638749.1 hypothetical protein [Rhizobium alarense]